jgi:hypothetical protein
VVAQGVDGNAPDLRIFSGSIVVGDHALNFVTKRFIERSLASNRSATRGFSTTPGFENLTASL